MLAEPGGIGVGSALAARLEELLAGEPVAELWVDVREDRPRGLQFAEQHGFIERARQAKAVLDLAAWRPEDFVGRIASIEAGGVRLLDFARTAGDERALRALYEINRVAALDDPSSAGGFPPYETWLGIVPQSSGFDAEGQILAEAGGRFVGLAAVGHSGEQAWNAITGVAPEFRGRGIGGALKVRAAEYAQAAGAVRLETETNAENATMRAINRSLGYEERPGYLTLSRSAS
ncbi:MAG TPA: GNAT family N-acetyltransferase [Gaiellaceae bacterium]|nr:GNAT family N-acetyltransferase [Gaiellaceae bacterium]